MLISVGLFAVVTPILAACSAAAPAPAAPAAPTATTAPAAQAAPATAPINISMAVFPDRPWMKRWAGKWQAANPNVTIKFDDIPYGDMNTKQLTELATNTMQDIVFSGNKWLRYSAFKGAFASMDDFIKAKPFDKEDMIPSAVNGGSFEGKQYGLPVEWNPGNINGIFYNKDLVAKMGQKEPTDTMSHQDYADWSVKMTDAKAGVFGTDMFPGTYYDFGDNVRDLGGDVMSDDGKKLLLGSDPKCLEVAHWFADFRTKLKSAPDRAGMGAEQLFPTGKIASTATNVNTANATAKSVGDKFKIGYALGVVGPGGLRGYDSFSLHWNIYSKSKIPETAYSLILGVSSHECALDALVAESQVPARLSVWADPAANKTTDIFKRTADWIGKGTSKGPFPIPDNLRYTELETAWENTGYQIFYGESNFDEGVKKTQDEMQKIMDQPRG